MEKQRREIGEEIESEYAQNRKDIKFFFTTIVLLIGTLGFHRI